jgi:glycosyltransferase involved in cell wall biosynthesis
MKISIVIPVYNEADGLIACLEAIANQTIKPYEVIVVDNNSSDGTCQVARKFDFVKLAYEPKQGVVHARTKGFDMAKGDIIARIDGDSILPSEWLESVEEVFSDSSIDASSGIAQYYAVAGNRVIDASDLYFRMRLSEQLKQVNQVYLWGANMAMRSSAWKKVRPHLCQKGNQHEDFDIAIHLQELGMKVTFDERLIANVSSRRIDTDFLSFMRYVMVSPKTYAQHGIKVKRYMYPIVAVCAIGYFPGYLLHKGYNPNLDKFSINRLLFNSTSVARVDPTTNVI